MSNTTNNFAAIWSQHQDDVARGAFKFGKERKEAVRKEKKHKTSEFAALDKMLGSVEFTTSDEE